MQCFGFFKWDLPLNYYIAGAEFIKNGSVKHLIGIQDHLERHLK